MFQVEWIDIEGVDHPVGVFQPHGAAVEIDQHPFVWIEVERIAELDAVHQMTVFGTYEG